MEINDFEFDEFILDTREKVLFRDGKPLSITPKAFQLLLVLVENHGHLIEKSDLIKAVWADSFVEDGNLTFTIRLLRKVLGDNSHQPRFIETVPRRGYRFITPVKKISAESSNKLHLSVQKFSSPSPDKKTTKRSNYFLIAASVVFLIAAFSFGSFYLQNFKTSEAIPLLDAPFTLEKLSTDGKVNHAVISLDGKIVFYVKGYGTDKQSVWLRQIESGNNVEIIPPSDVIYVGLALSPDGNFLYLSRRPKGFDGQANIFRISIFGGVPTKIIEETQGWISISPDGEKISYVRCYYLKNDNCSLWMADAFSGKNEKKLASRPQPFRIGDNEFSPTGKTLAFTVGQSKNQANEFTLMEVNVESGVERLLTEEKFFNIKSLVWLPNRNDLLITALKVPDMNYRIWQVSGTSGKIQPLTKNSETYSTLSIDKTAANLVSTQVKPDFHLYILNIENPADKKVLTNATHAFFASDKKIIFSSSTSGNDEIWSVNTDSSEEKQLTSNTASDGKAVLSTVNNLIYFSSNRTGKIQIWCMDANGENQTQVTKKEGGFPIFVTLDGNWIYYQHGLDRTLWRVSSKNDQEQLVLDKAISRIAFSPDGLRMAVLFNQGKSSSIIISLVENQKILKTINFSGIQTKLVDLTWMPDGKNLTYILADNEFKNNILWIESLDRGKPQKIADLGKEQISETSGFSVSPDGKHISFIQGSWKHDVILLTGLK